MAINERLVHTASAAAAAGGGTGNQEEGLILHLDANDVDSYDGDGDVWYDIKDHEYTPSTNVSEHFNTVIYTGDGSTSNSITGVGFQPDLVWVKQRNLVQYHSLSNSVSGVGKMLWPNSTDAEYSTTTYGQIASFDSDGFTANKGSDPNYSYFNASGGTYVAWCLKAGGAPSGSDKVSIDGTSYADEAAAGLTAGTLAVDKLSANTKLGFSIVKTTGTSGTINFGHGLDTAPEMIINKGLTSNGWSWLVYHKDIGTGKYLKLNSVDAETSNAGSFSSVTSTTITNNSSNGSSDYINYCFTSKRGVSKVGSYVGGAAGNKVYTGFEPAWVMVKRSSTTGAGWYIIDNKRDTNTNKNKYISANTNAAEATSGSNITFNRDGFTFNGTSYNTNGATHIYYAVAKNTNETGLVPSKDDFTAGSIETTDLELNLDANSYSGSGDWLDGTSNYNNGTISNATYINDGNADYFSFNGSTSYISTSLTWSGSTTLSFSCWVKITSIGVNQYIFADFNSGGANTSFRFGVRITSGNDLQVGTNNGGTGTFYSFGDVSSFINVYKNITVTVSGTEVKAYVNGTQFGSTASQGTALSAGVEPFQIGVYGPGSNKQNLNGQIGQVSMYSSVLTQAQVQSNYEATKIYNLPSLDLHLDAASFDGSTNTPTTWTDSSSNSNNGTISGATFDSELGNWLDFDGTNDKVEIPMDFSGDGSIEAWVNLTNINTDNAIATKYESGTDNRTFAWYIYGSGNAVFSVYYNSNGNGNAVQFDMSDYFTSGKWHHITHTFGASSRPTIYIDGEAISELSQYNSSSTNVPYSRPSVPVVLGAFTSGSGANDLDGKIGQFRLYSTTLTQEQIKQNYNFTKSNYPNGNDFVGINMDSSDWNSNGYFSFNGTNDYFDGAGFTPSLTDVQTVSYWIRNQGAGSTEMVMTIGQTGSSNVYSWINFAYDNTGKINASYGTTNGDISNKTIANSASIVNTWYHVCFLVFPENRGTSNQCFKIYIDGSEVAVTNSTTAGTLPTVQGYPIIGRYSAQNSLRLSGDLSKLRIYNRRITEAEITTLYNEGE